MTIGAGTAAGNGRTALVVGATGIAGSAVVDALAGEGWDVLALSRRPGAERPGVRWLSADLTSVSALTAVLAPENPSHVFFTAWSRRATEEENIAVNAGMAEAAHWPAIQAQRAGGDKEIPGLQAAIPKCDGLVGFGICEPALRTRIVAVEPRQMSCEVHIITKDRSDRRFHRLPYIAGIEMRLEPFFGWFRRQEYDACRRDVGRCGTPAHQVVDSHQHSMGDRLVYPFARGVCFAKKRIQCGIADGVMRFG